MKACVALFCLLGAMVSCNGQSINCFGFPDGTIFNNPLVDTFYYLCSGGIPVPMECMPGYIFCEGGTSCAASCLTTPNSTDTTPSPVSCSGRVDGTVFNNPLVDSLYYVCVSGIPVPMECTPGYIFCEGGTSCAASCSTTPSSTVTTPSPVACSGRADGTLFADSTNCKGYYMCVGGNAVAGTCMNNYSFSSTMGTCVAAPCTT